MQFFLVMFMGKLILKRHRDSDLRKLMSKDLTLAGKEVSHKNSNKE